MTPGGKTPTFEYVIVPPPEGIIVKGGIVQLAVPIYANPKVIFGTIEGTIV